MNQVLHGDCLEQLTILDADSVDLMATDPPYGYEFMGKGWDRGVASEEVWKECLRVLKPGGFAFVMSTPRQDLLAQSIVNLRDAGFDISTTSLYWAYTSGRPVAIDIGVAVDRKLGVEREVVATVRRMSGWSWQNTQNFRHGYRPKNYARTDDVMNLTEATSEEAKELDGSYSHFKPKPATEVVIVAKKPNAKSSAVDQAMDNGKGVTWLEDARIPFANADDERRVSVGFQNARGLTGDEGVPAPAGRFPANLLCSDDSFDDYSMYFDLDLWWTKLTEGLPEAVRDRLPYIFCSKAGVNERGDYNEHPTVKPIKLMSYLVILGSRAGDLVLDPFAGSGSTLIAAKILDRLYVGIEKEDEYVELIERRLSEWHTVADLTVNRSGHRVKEEGIEYESFV